MDKTIKYSRGLAQIPLMIALLLMAIAVPLATKLVQNNQDNRDYAAGIKNEGTSSVTPKAARTTVTNVTKMPTLRPADKKNDFVCCKKGSSFNFVSKCSGTVVNDSKCQNDSSGQTTTSNKQMSPDFGVYAPKPVGTNCAFGDKNYCGFGMHCTGTVSGTCQKNLNIGDKCTWDADCDSNRCIGYKCIAPRTGCDPINHCAVGMYCSNDLGGNCLPNKPLGADCEDDIVCYPYTCDKTSSNLLNPMKKCGGNTTSSTSSNSAEKSPSVAKQNDTLVCCCKGASCGKIPQYLCENIVGSVSRMEICDGVVTRAPTSGSSSSGSSSSGSSSSGGKKSSSGGSSNNSSSSGTINCDERCPNAKDGYLYNCTPEPDFGGSPITSICNAAGRAEQCGNACFVCPSVNGQWQKQTDMSKCNNSTTDCNNLYFYRTDTQACVATSSKYNGTQHQCDTLANTCAGNLAAVLPGKTTGKCYTSQVACESDNNGSTTNGTPILNYKVAFGGVNPTSSQCVVDWPLQFTVLSGGVSAVYSDVIPPTRTVVGDHLQFSGSLVLSGFNKTSGIAVFVQGPKHLQMKYGINNQTSAYNKAGGEITLTTVFTTSPIYDFTGYPMVPGDVLGVDSDAQDGWINGVDFAYVKSKSIVHETVADGGYLQGDLDGNCQVNSNDVNLLKISLEEKQGQLY